MTRIGSDSLGSDAAVTPRKKRLPGHKSNNELQKELLQKKIEEIKREKENHEGETYSVPSASEEDIEDEYQQSELNRKLRGERESQERADEQLKKEVDGQMDAEFRYRQGQQVPHHFPKKPKKEGKEGRETRVGFI